MITRRVVGSVVMFAFIMVAGGCMPKLTMEDLKQMKPQRPVELDKLSDFLGTWESTATMTLTGLDEPLTGKGKETFSWACDGWCLLGQGQYEMGEMGTMHFVGVWTYDAKAKKYRIFMANSNGETETGSARFDAGDNEWEMKSKSRGPWGSMIGEGEMKIVKDGQMEWEFTARDAMWRMKVMEGSGTSMRK